MKRKRKLRLRFWVHREKMTTKKFPINPFGRNVCVKEINRLGLIEVGTIHLTLKCLRNTGRWDEFMGKGQRALNLWMPRAMWRNFACIQRFVKWINEADKLYNKLFIYYLFIRVIIIERSNKLKWKNLWSRSI